MTGQKEHQVLTSSVARKITGLSLLQILIDIPVLALCVNIRVTRYQTTPQGTASMGSSNLPSLTLDSLDLAMVQLRTDRPWTLPPT